MTWVALGALAAGCGSGSGPDENVPLVDDDPPASADDPPFLNYDQPPASADDAPPANADAPGGAIPPDDDDGDDDDAEGLCRQLCSDVDVASCANLTAAQLVSQICDTNCQLTTAQQACENEFKQALECVLDVENLCTSESAGQVTGCQQRFSNALACAADGGSTDPGGTGCDLANQCTGCSDTCETCRCAAGEQADATCASFCM